MKLAALAGSLALSALPAAAQVDAVQGIAAAFERHPVVLIGEAHSIAQAGAFYRRLVRDPAFQRATHDIVIEFASRHNQALLDRYVAGEELPADELRRLWRDTTKVAAWESPVYAGWLAEIREVNRALPPGQRLRVHAGDTAIDWNRMTRERYRALPENNDSIAEVVVERILQRQRRALVVLGSNHVMKSGDRRGGPDATTRIESRFKGSAEVILMLHPRAIGPIAQALAPADVAAPALLPPGELRDRADELLYLGPLSELEESNPKPGSAERDYLVELDRRGLIEWGELRNRLTPGLYGATLRPGFREGMTSPRIAALRRQLEAGDERAL